VSVTVSAAKHWRAAVSHKIGMRLSLSTIRHSLEIMPNRWDIRVKVLCIAITLVIAMYTPAR